MSNTADCAKDAGRPLVDSLSIVVPVYNSEGSLTLLCDRLSRVLPGLARRWELVLVNDCSPDGSWETIEKLVGQYDWVRGINLMRNFGQQNATLCGIRAARSDVIVTMDDDLQNPPEQIAPLLAKLQEGYDVVYGPPTEERHGLLRDLASQVTKIVLQEGMGSEVARNISSFRALRSNLRAAFDGPLGPSVSIDVLLTWSTSRFAMVRVPHAPRELGQSGYSLRKLIEHAMNMVTGFSVIPLQVASIIGFVVSGFGTGMLLLVLFEFFVLGNPVRGFTFLASSIAIFSGAQLLALGVIGEYLARLYFRSMGRPTYATRKEIGAKAVEDPGPVR